MTKTDNGMEVGRLSDRVEVLGLRLTSADVPPQVAHSESVSSEDVTAMRAWAWEMVRRTWASAKLMSRPNVYSVHGLGAAGVTFTLRRQPLNLDSALWWRGQHCLITAIRPLGRLYLTVDAALVVLSRCRDPKTGDTFPAVMTEEYVRQEQMEPMAKNICQRVLVTPKAVKLTPGPLVEVDGVEWPIITPYELDPHKNEYTLRRKATL